MTYKRADKQSFHLVQEIMLNNLQAIREKKRMEKL